MAQGRKGDQMNQSWFEVDKEGLARILKRRGLQFIAYELVANAWDSKATQATVTLEPVGGKRLARITVEDDDPNGFEDITHAFTMFADSNRRADAEKRGRFNLGEKLALAIAKEARIITTTAAYRFDETGRHRMEKRTDKGSRIELIFPATKQDIDDIKTAMQQLIPPIPTTFNGQTLGTPKPLTKFDASLETVLPDDEGNLKSHVRKTVVEVYQNGHSMLYEMGIPVVETGDTYSYNVLQKVPVNLDRDNVPPHYLRTLRVKALNELHDKLDSEDFNKTWARDALTDKRVAPEAVLDAVKGRFGDKVVSFDPTDLEANSKAVANGYTVVHGKQMSAAEWENVRNAGAIKPAGQVCPTPRPFSPTGDPIELLPSEEWTDGMRQIVEYTHRLFRAWFRHDIEVYIAKPRNKTWSACYGDGQFYFAVNQLGRDWFNQGITNEVVALLIHEGAHEKESNHLSSHYYDVCCELGAKMRNLKHLEEGL